MLDSGADTMIRAGGGRSVLYLQFTDPAGYPPLEYSARILRNCGWNVRFLGICWYGSQRMSFGADLDEFVGLLNAPSRGWRQKLFYLRYTISAVKSALMERPDIDNSFVVFKVREDIESYVAQESGTTRRARSCTRTDDGWR